MRITANAATQALTVTVAGQITASATSRTLGGPIVRYGEYGRTSAGRLRVRAGALRFPDDLSRVKLTEEHNRDKSRGHLVQMVDDGTGIRVTAKVSDGPLGDAALLEADDKTRDGFSFDVVDATVEGDEITDALVIAIGQVGIPAYDDLRIDSIAAAASNNPGENMTAAQRARLAELIALDTRTPEQEAELEQLTALAEANPEAAQAAVPDAPAAPSPAAGQVAASIPAVPPVRPAAQTQPRGSAFDRMVREVTAGLRSVSEGGNGLQQISAALTDVIHTAHTSDIEQVAWSGELWSGLKYEPEWSDLFTTGPLTNWEGKGWRFLTTPSMQDYAGDKAAIPSGSVTTEDSTYEAARMAVGVDIDRKFYDFPNEAFVSGLFEKVRESWEIQLDAKIRAYVLAQSVVSTRTASVTTTNADATVTAATGTFKASDVGATITGTGIPGGTTILTVTNTGSIELSANATASGTVTATIGNQESSLIKAAARAALTLKRRRVGKASWIVVNDEDLFDLLDVTEDDLPAFLDLYGIEPKNFRSSPDVAPGTVLAGVKQAATVRTLPGSPIRVSAQHLANGGIDEAFFGYWAIEEHHTSGIATVTYKPAA
jgi:hypothetical protein